MLNRLKYVAVWLIAGLCLYFGYQFLAGGSGQDTGSATGAIDWDNDGPPLIYYLVLLGVLLPALFVYRPRLSDLAKGVLLWGGLAVLLVTGYAYRFELEPYAAPVLSALVPGYAFEGGDGAVVLSRSDDGHFRANARINGAATSVLVDTGASTVTLTYETAIAAGFDPDALSFSVPVSTANGIARASAVRLQNITIGSLSFDNVDAMIAEKGRLRSNLLGLSFLSLLSSYSVSGDRMTMKN